MRRYYSHYTFIYPNICLKNHIVELDDEGRIAGYFPFVKEIEKTEFHAGLLIFLPDNVEEKPERIIHTICRKYATDAQGLEYGVIRYKQE
jgi:hypothetical protein